MVLRKHKVINSMKEYRCMNIGQLKFYMSKYAEHEKLMQKQAELNKRFVKK